MRILVTNDDGIYSPGLVVLAHAAARFGQVRIVAPDVEQSSMAFAVTATRPLRHRHASIAGFDAFRVDGTPADCVALGTHVWGNVDLVVSGVNLGLNVGNAMWHSGTLAAAKQAVLLGMRGIAFSAPAIEGVSDYKPIIPWLERILADLIAVADRPLLNVNFPAQPRGIEWTRQSVRLYDGRLIPTKDPWGTEVFWFAPIPRDEAEPGTDRCAVESGMVSITPLRLDLTDEAALRGAQPLA
jgi:5'-nucleotidase